MIRTWLIGAALFTSAAWGQAPAYSAEKIVNAANFTAGPLAPNAAVTIFGTNLAWWEETLTVENTRAGSLPASLADVRVYVANYPAPLLYVGPTQINFLVPGNLRTGSVPVRVVRQGVTGPEVAITLVDAVPQFFRTPEGYVIAQHADYSVVTPDHPAVAGEMIVIYATGLGMTQPNPGPGEIPAYPGLITQLPALRVTVGGVAVPSRRILYAGLTPGWAGLYQINLFLPDILDLDPEVRASIGDQAGMPGLKLATGPR